MSSAVMRGSATIAYLPPGLNILPIAASSQVDAVTVLADSFIIEDLGGQKLFLMLLTEGVEGGVAYTVGLLNKTTGQIVQEYNATSVNNATDVAMYAFDFIVVSDTHEYQIYISIPSPNPSRSLALYPPSFKAVLNPGGGGGGGGSVSSVFGRTGAVIADAGDYDSDQVDNASAVSGASVSDALDTLNAQSSRSFGANQTLSAGTYVLAQTDNGKVFDNFGAGGMVDIEIPNTITGPMSFLVVLTSANEMRITPTGAPPMTLRLGSIGTGSLLKSNPAEVGTALRVLIAGTAGNRIIYAYAVGGVWTD